jgi:tetratricopeptide (TPR) repeat protein
MSVGRWLLIHSFAIFVVTLLILGYLYREPLQLQQIYQALLMQPSTETGVLKTDPEPQRAVSSKLEKPEQLVEQQKLQQESTTSNKTNPSPEQYLESSPTVSLVAVELDERLLKARKAYWEKDYPRAIHYYQQLIQDDENNPDFPGELGNIYYSLNDYENASMYLYGAAMILVKQQKKQQAQALVSPISAMNHDLGDQLRRQLTQP